MVVDLRIYSKLVQRIGALSQDGIGVVVSSGCDCQVAILRAEQMTKQHKSRAVTSCNFVARVRHQIRRRARKQAINRFKIEVRKLEALIENHPNAVRGRDGAILKVGTVFSGMGNAVLALEKSKVCHQVGFAIGNSKSCRKLLRKRYKITQLHGKLENVHIEKLPRVDYVQFSPTCISFSTNGKGDGMHSEATGFLPLHTAKVIVVNRPRAFIEENVRGFTFQKHRLLRAATRGILSLAGYTIFERVLNAKLVGGVKQSRQRFYRVGIHKTCYSHEFN